jgi:hypothetical protein
VVGLASHHRLVRHRLMARIFVLFPATEDLSVNLRTMNDIDTCSARSVPWGIRTAISTQASERKRGLLSSTTESSSKPHSITPIFNMSNAKDMEDNASL